MFRAKSNLSFNIVYRVNRGYKSILFISLQNFQSFLSYS